MKKVFLLMPLLVFWILSCTHEEKLQADKKIQFSFANVSKGTGGGSKEINGSRVSDASTVGDPQSVMVTIKDDAGNTIVAQQTLALTKFGDSFLSLPLTLKASSASNYHLSEFFVIGSDNQVDYTTPREGSTLAHLVTDPLDILFTVDVNNITTVTPEVLAVTDSSKAADYGYGQFGFSVVKTITTVFSSFIKGTSNFELTAAHLKIEGLKDSTSSDTTALWIYETDLAAKANTIVLKDAVAYKITATKDGYEPWIRTMTLQSSKTIEIFFEKGNEVDVYTAGSVNIGGYNYAAYWKNGVRVQLSTKVSVANDIFVSNGDVYVAGSETGTANAFYWKNGTQIFLPKAGATYKIFVAGNDVYLLGSTPSGGSSTIPWYSKNGVLSELTPEGSFVSIFSSFFVDGTDVYATGSQIVQLSSWPVFWKNGIATKLQPPSSSSYQELGGYATGLKVEDGHVYVAGVVNMPEAMVYWKDGQSTVLPFTSSIGVTTQLDVENGDVYVAGMLTSTSNTNKSNDAWRGCYWKNGEQFFLATQSYLNLYCMRVRNGKIYIAGTHNDSGTAHGYFATYWVDGKQTNCEATQESYAYGMFVAAK